jgi:hypothetical protein
MRRNGEDRKARAEEFPKSSLVAVFRIAVDKTTSSSSSILKISL